MAVSSKRARRSRYTRQEPTAPLVLTPCKWRLLTAVATLDVPSLPQLADFCGITPKCARNNLRPLFDAGMINVVAVPRAALARPADGNDLGLAFGSAPNLYTLAKAGGRLLVREGLLERWDTPPHYGPRNALFLAHQLAVQEVRVWLERVTRHHPSVTLRQWRMGQEAVLNLARPVQPGAVRPDAWFVLQVGTAVLVGLVEADRGTERGVKRWQEKIVAYQSLFASGQLKAVLGYQHARALVVTPSAARREALAQLLAQHAPPALAQRFWLTEDATLKCANLSASVWQQPGSSVLRPLAPPALLLKATDKEGG